MDKFDVDDTSFLKFSLIVATKNRVAELEALFQSLVDQKYEHLQTIVVDQNDDDRLAGLIQTYQSKLELLHVKSETGLSKARNAGLKLVSGDIIAFPDDDCLYPTDLLDRLNHWFVRQPETDGVAGSLTETIELPFRKATYVVNKRNVWKTVKSATIFVRRHVISKTGDFDENLGIGSPNGLGAGEETDYLLRVLRHGFHVVQNTEIRVVHPPIIKDFAQYRKVFSYTKGASYVFRKYQFPVSVFLYQLVRPLVGIVFFSLLFQNTRVKYYYYSLKGKLSGYFYPANP
jgi:glycosyltransferase involved in cell wall biosynthesis